MYDKGFDFPVGPGKTVNMEDSHPTAENPLVPHDFRARVAVVVFVWVWPLFWILFLHHSFSPGYMDIDGNAWRHLVNSRNQIVLARLYVPFVAAVVWFSAFQILAVGALYDEQVILARRLALFHLGGTVFFLIVVRDLVAFYSWLFPPIIAFSVLVAWNPRFLGEARYHIPALCIVFGALAVNCMTAGFTLPYMKNMAAFFGIFTLGFFLLRFIAVIKENHLPFLHTPGASDNHFLHVGSNASICGHEDVVLTKGIRESFTLRLCYLERPKCQEKNSDTGSVWITRKWLANCPNSAVDRLRSILMDHCYDASALLLFNPENDAVWDTNGELDWYRRRVAFLFQRIKRRSPTAGIGRQQLMEKLPALLSALQYEKTSPSAPAFSRELDTVPYPFAWILFDLHRSSSPDDKFYLFTSLFEAVIHTLGVFCITHCVNTVPTHSAVSVLSEKIYRSPALGDWLQAVELYSRREPETLLASILKKKVIDAEISEAIKRCRIVFGLQDANRPRTVLDLLWFLIHLRNQTIGHGAFIYRVPETVDGVLSTLTVFFRELVAQLGLGLRLDDGSEKGCLLNGLDPALTSDPGLEPAQIGIAMRNTPSIRTNYLQYHPGRHDVFYFNGMFHERSEWKSYLTGDYLVETAHSTDVV